MAARHEGLGEAIGGDWQDTLADLRALRGSVTEVGDELAELARREGALARAELGENASLIAQGALCGVAAIPFAVLTIAFVSLAAMFALALALPLWASAAIIAVVLAAIAVTLALVARSRFTAAQLMPQQTMHSLREDIRWAREQLKRNAA